MSDQEYQLTPDVIDPIVHGLAPHVVEIPSEFDQHFEFSRRAGSDAKVAFQLALRSDAKTLCDVGGDRNRSASDLAGESEPLGVGERVREAVELSRELFRVGEGAVAFEVTHETEISDAGDRVKGRASDATRSSE